MNKNQKLVPVLSIETIRGQIYTIRGKRVMVDRDLAILYQVLTKQLNRAVRRNIERFPEDFMFEMTKEEMENWKYQIGTSNYNLKQSLRKPPLVFTEQGIAMLSSVLNSSTAIQVNIQIIRIFTRLREMIEIYKELRDKVEEMEIDNEFNFKQIFKAIRLLVKRGKRPKGKIGFDTGLEN